MYTLITKLRIFVEWKWLFCEREYKLPFVPYPGLNIDNHGQVSSNLMYSTEQNAFVDSKSVSFLNINETYTYNDVLNLMRSRRFTVTNEKHGYNENGEYVEWVVEKGTVLL